VRRADSRRNQLWGLVATAVLISIAVAAAEAAGAPYGGVLIRLWLVALGGLAAWAVAGSALARWTYADPPRRRFSRSPPPEQQLPDLLALQHAIEFSRATAFDLHYRLRPTLMKVAGERLAARGLDLRTEPDACRALFGPQAWEILRPDLPAPPRRGAPGIPLSTLRLVVERLDAI